MYISIVLYRASHSVMLNMHTPFQYYIVIVNHIMIHVCTLRNLSMTVNTEVFDFGIAIILILLLTNPS